MERIAKDISGPPSPIADAGNKLSRHEEKTKTYNSSPRLSGNSTKKFDVLADLEGEESETKPCHGEKADYLESTQGKDLEEEALVSEEGEGIRQQKGVEMDFSSLEEDSIDTSTLELIIKSNTKIKTWVTKELKIRSMISNPSLEEESYSKVIHCMRLLSPISPRSELRIQQLPVENIVKEP